MKGNTMHVVIYDESGKNRPTIRIDREFLHEVWQAGGERYWCEDQGTRFGQDMPPSFQEFLEEKKADWFFTIVDETTSARDVVIQTMKLNHEMTIVPEIANELCALFNIDPDKPLQQGG
jgi:hypothetical protein